MIFHPPVPDRTTIKRKARLARRRSRHVWSDAYLPLSSLVRIQARITLRDNIRGWWKEYRQTVDPVFRLKIRRHIHVQLLAVRLLT